MSQTVEEAKDGVFAISQTAREIADLRSISGREGNKKGDSSELPEMSWWSMDAKNKLPLTFGTFSDTQIS